MQSRSTTPVSRGRSCVVVLTSGCISPFALFVGGRRFDVGRFRSAGEGGAIARVEMAREAVIVAQFGNPPVDIDRRPGSPALLNPPSALGTWRLANHSSRPPRIEDCHSTAPDVLTIAQGGHRTRPTARLRKPHPIPEYVATAFRTDWFLPQLFAPTRDTHTR